MDRDLRADAESPGGPVGIPVTQKQPELKEHEARAPDRRTAAERRQELLGDYRLDEEQQQRAGENTRRVGSDAGRELGSLRACWAGRGHEWTGAAAGSAGETV